MKHSAAGGGLRGWVLNLQRPYHHATCPLAAHTVDARAIGGYHALVYRAAANRDKSSRLTGRPPGCPAALGGHRVQCPAVGARTAAVYRLGGWGNSLFTGWPASRTSGNPVGGAGIKTNPEEGGHTYAINLSKQPPSGQATAAVGCLLRDRRLHLSESRPTADGTAHHVLHHGPHARAAHVQPRPQL